MPEPQRRAAHILIDAVSATHHQHEPSSDADAANTEAVQIALADLQASGAVHVVAHEDDEQISIEVDVSDLVSPALAIVDHLIDELAEASGDDEAVIVSELRDYVDGDESPFLRGGSERDADDEQTRPDSRHDLGDIA